MKININMGREHEPRENLVFGGKKMGKCSNSHSHQLDWTTTSHHSWPCSFPFAWSLEDGGHTYLANFLTYNSTGQDRIGGGGPKKAALGLTQT